MILPLYFEENGDRSIFKGFICGGFSSHQQRKDFNCGSRCRGDGSQEEEVILYNSA